MALARFGLRTTDPLFLKIYRCGSVTAAIGFVLGIFGKGKLRIPAILSSPLMIAVWFTSGTDL